MRKMRPMIAESSRFVNRALTQGAALTGGEVAGAIIPPQKCQGVPPDFDKSGGTPHDEMGMNRSQKARICACLPF